LLLPPGADGKTFKGRDQIAAFWQGGIDAGLTNLKLTTHETEHVGDDWVVETSSYAHSAGHGNYIVIWKRQHGKWELYKDIFNV